MDRKLTNPTNNLWKWISFFVRFPITFVSSAASNKLQYNLLLYLKTTSQLPALQPDLILESRIENLI